MRKLISVLALSFLLWGGLKAQCVSVNTCVPDSGETLKYAAYFNWSAIWVKGGEAVFKAEVLADKLHYTLKAQTMPKWRWVYDMTTEMEAYMNKADLKPISYRSDTHEDKKDLHEEMVFSNGKLHYERWRAGKTKYKSKVVDHPDCSYDLVNEIYAARNLDLASFKPGQQIPFNVFFSSKMSTIYGEVIGPEKKKTKSGKTYDCIKCKTNTIPHSMFDASTPVYVWVTNDERHIPIAVDCKIKFGHIKVLLED